MRYLKKENDKIIEWTGCYMGSTWFVDNNWMPYAGSAQLRYLDIVNDAIIDNTPAPEVLERERKLARTIFTRLQIRDGFIELGIEPMLDMLIVSDPLFERYWIEADWIDLNHPVTVTAMSGFSPEEIEAIILAIK